MRRHPRKILVVWIFGDYLPTVLSSLQELSKDFLSFNPENKIEITPPDSSFCEIGYVYLKIRGDYSFWVRHIKELKGVGGILASEFNVLPITGLRNIKNTRRVFDIGQIVEVNFGSLCGLRGMIKEQREEKVFVLLQLFDLLITAVFHIDELISV